MNLHIEAVENKRNWSYGFSLEILNSSVPDTVNIKFDNGAGYTVISASVFLDELTDSAAERIEKKLRERESSRSGSSSMNAAPFRMKFQSATGDLMTGYLCKTLYQCDVHRRTDRSHRRNRAGK